MTPGRGALAALAGARPLFADSTKAPALARLIGERLPPGRVRWLEVGAGDGHNLALMLSALAPGRVIDVVAIEPDSTSRGPDAGGLTLVDWRAHALEDYRPAGTFNWINVRHSAYYFDNPLSRLVAMVSWLAVGGSLSLTHWSRACALRRLHEELCGPSAAATTGDVEEFASALARLPGFLVEGPFVHAADLDVDALGREPAAVRALADLARRGHPELPGADRDLLTVARRAVGAGGGTGARRNGLLVVRRSFSPDA